MLLFGLIWDWPTTDHWFYMFCICPNAGAHDSKLLFDPLYINYKAMTYDKTERKEKKNPKLKKNKTLQTWCSSFCFFPPSGQPNKCLWCMLWVCPCFNTVILSKRIMSPRNNLWSVLPLEHAYIFNPEGKLNVCLVFGITLHLWNLACCVCVCVRDY